MAREMADLGFAWIELSHGIRITLVPGILRAVEEGVVKISSTHNFCPLPVGIERAAPNLFEPSARDPRERAQWLRQTKRSIDFAAQVKAEVLVCHLGSVHFLLGNPAGKLRTHLRRHPPGSIPHDSTYAELLVRAGAKRRRRMEPFWENTKASINAVLDHAAQKNVRLGFENRERFEELPIDEDFPALFAGFPAGAPVGYWHDTGHADIKGSLGLLDPQVQLEKLAPHLIGFHLHDVNAEGQDHQPVGSGRIDFNAMRRFWRPEHRLVLELNPRVAVEDVIRSKQRIETLLAQAPR
jgi:sugar phosphate isomerase/epimerase